MAHRDKIKTTWIACSVMAPYKWYLLTFIAVVRYARAICYLLAAKIALPCDNGLKNYKKQ